MKVYHYTDRGGKEAIERSGQIRPSTGGAYGPGTYLTTMPPTSGKQAVSRNNWTTQGTSSRADYVFELELPDWRLRRPAETGGRDIVIHDGPVQLLNHKGRTV